MSMMFARQQLLLSIIFAVFMPAISYAFLTCPSKDTLNNVIDNSKEHVIDFHFKFKTTKFPTSWETWGDPPTMKLYDTKGKVISYSSAKLGGYGKNSVLCAYNVIDVYKTAKKLVIVNQEGPYTEVGEYWGEFRIARNVCTQSLEGCTFLSVT